MQPLIAGPRVGLPAEVVLASLASPHPRVRHGVDVLDPETMQETGESLPVDADAGGHVEWRYRPSDSAASATDTVSVRRKATLNLAGPVDDDLLLGRFFRIWTEMQAPTGEWVRWWLGVFMSTLPGRRWDKHVVRRELHLVPREHLWATRTLDDWQTIPGDAVVFDEIRSDLADVFGITHTAFPTPEGETTVQEDMTFPAGTSFLAKWTRMAHAIGFDQPVTDEAGTPTSQPLATLANKGPEITYRPGANRLVEEAAVDPLDPELPNVVRFFARRGPSLPEEGNGWVTWRNETSGPASISARGFEVYREVTADASNQTELEAFAAAEAQRFLAGGGTRITFQVGLNPRHSDRDVVRVVHPALEVDATVLPTSWRYPLRRITTEEAVLMPIEAEQRVAAVQDEVAA